MATISCMKLQTVQHQQIMHVRIMVDGQFVRRLYLKQLGQKP